MAACGKDCRVKAQEDDARLIASSLNDPALFGQIFDRHAPVLLRYLLRRVGAADAEELLGDTFRIAFETRDRFDLGRSSAQPWLYGIAANLVRKHFRTRQRRDRAELRLVGRRDASHIDVAESVVDELERDGRWTVVKQSITELPNRDREVLWLYVWEDLSYAEIAEALEIPVGTVRSRLNRVRQTLRELDPGVGKEPGDPQAATPKGTKR